MIDEIKNALKIMGNALPLPTRLKQFYLENGMKWDEINILGIRGTNDFYTNKFLCLLALATDTDLIVLRATTVPGPNWTPENCKKFDVSFAAVMCLGFYPNSYGLTKHRDHPPGFALGQRAPIKCFVDENRNSKMDEKPYIDKSNAMNIHSQSIGDTDEKVNFASAGCQVAQSRELFLNVFMPAVRSSVEGKKGNAGRFNYFLTDFEQFPFYSELKKLAK